VFASYPVEKSGTEPRYIPTVGVIFLEELIRGIIVPEFENRIDLYNRRPETVICPIMTVWIVE
jgi:hypothetical protein